MGIASRSSSPSDKSPRPSNVCPYDGGYHRAQFLATQMALAERGRAVVSLTLKDLEPRTIDELDEFFRETAQCLKDLLKRAARTQNASS